MKTRILIASIIVFTLIGLGLLAIASIGSTKEEKEVSYKNMKITLKNENTEIEEEIHLNEVGNLISIAPHFINVKEENIKIYLEDGTEIKSIGIIANETRDYNKYMYFYYESRDQNIKIVNRDKNPILNNKVIIKYYIKTEEIAKEYNNTSVINIKNNNVVIKEITIAIPRATQNFVISDKRVTYTKLDNKTYILNTKEMSKNIKISVDKGSIVTRSKVNEVYNIEKAKNNEEIIIVIFNTMVVLLSIINIFIVYMIRKHKKYDKSYNRDTEGVIDVTLAESIVDKKINSNNLIMATIVEQITCGNILMEDEELILKKQATDSEVKRNIIKMIFGDKETTKITEISNVFKDETQIDNIINIFKRVKKKITENFYNLNIYDTKKENKVKKNRKISIYIIVAIIIYLLYMLYGLKYSIIATIVTFIFYRLAMMIIKKSTIIKIIPVAGLPIVFFGIVLIGSITQQYKPLTTFTIKPIELIIMIAVAIINFITIGISKKHIYTKEGIEEEEKVKGLYNYLKEYSLIKERDMQSVVIWDKYLVYATAFGIPSKVTEKFAKELMGIAQTLDKINRLLVNED